MGPQNRTLNGHIRTSICPTASTSRIKSRNTLETVALRAFTGGKQKIVKTGERATRVVGFLTFCPDRGLSHRTVHNAAQQQVTDAGGYLRVAGHEYLEVLRGVHVFKVDASPVLLGVEEDGIDGCGVADVGGPDAGEGRYRVAHDARGEELRLVVAGGEGVWHAARLAGELAKDGLCGFVVSDDAAPRGVARALSAPT